MTVTVCTPALKQMIPAFGTSFGLDDVLLSLRLATEVSGSPMKIRNGPAGVSTKVVRFAIGKIVGGLFVEPTVNRNESLAPFRPSLTLKVMVAAPVCPAAGVTRTVRLAPLPSRMIFSNGTRFGSDELAVTVRLSTGESASSIENAIAGVVVLGGVD